MKIERNGVSYELTKEELSAAHREFVRNWMLTELENTFGVESKEDREAIADNAFDIYAEGNGDTEYKALEKAYDFHSGEEYA